MKERIPSEFKMNEIIHAPSYCRCLSILGGKFEASISGQTGSAQSHQTLESTARFRPVFVLLTRDPVPIKRMVSTNSLQGAYFGLVFEKQIAPRQNVGFASAFAVGNLGGGKESRARVRGFRRCYNRAKKTENTFRRKLDG
jgi:hypothetical protein